MVTLTYTQGHRNTTGRQRRAIMYYKGRTKTVIQKLDEIYISDGRGFCLNFLTCRIEKKYKDTMLILSCLPLFLLWLVSLSQ